MAVNNWRYISIDEDPQAWFSQPIIQDFYNYVGDATEDNIMQKTAEWIYNQNHPVLTESWPWATNTSAPRGKATPLPDQPVVTKSWPPENYTNKTTTQNNYWITPFSNIDVYNLKSQWYANQWNNSMANAFWNIANSLWSYSRFANDAVSSADALLNYIRWNETGLQNVAWNLYNSLLWDLQTQRDYVNRMFWPEWELTQEVNKYYSDLWNYLATDAGRQAATIAAQWVHSWASLGSIRAQQNEAYNNSFQRYIQAKEQQINAKQQIASNLINFMSTLRKEYWDTTNQYVIELYKRANDMYNSIAQNLASEINWYNKLKIQASSWGWWGGDSLKQMLTILWLGSLYDKLNGSDGDPDGKDPDKKDPVVW